MNTDYELLTHYLEFGLRPVLFIPGQFDASIVGGVHPLTIRGSSLGTIETQVHVFLIAPSGVIDPFVPRIAVSLILDHVELFDALKTSRCRILKIQGVRCYNALRRNFMIDSHCHLDCIDVSEREGGVQSVLDLAHAHGVDRMLCISITLGNDGPRQLAKAYEPVWATVGIHPCHAHEEPEVTIEHLLRLAKADSVIALGETGLDGFHDPVTDAQRESFVTHLEAGKQAGLPIVVHTRDARDETIELIKAHGSAEVAGVLHCFTESWEMAEQAIDLGYYISMSGIVSFPKATNVHEVCRKIPADRLLIETDAPWLAPVPHRGKPNEPAFVSHVAEAVAALRGTSAGAIAEQTTENFYRLFRAASA